MTKKKFTEEEMLILKNNPYTQDITTDMIRFTNAFRQEYIRRYLNRDNPIKIFYELGYDVEVLGKKRIYSFDSRIRGKAADSKIIESKVRKEEDIAALIVKLQHEVAYLRQELEFLKKIIKLESNRK